MKKKNLVISKIAQFFNIPRSQQSASSIVEFSGGEDSSSFSLVTRPGWDKAEILTMVDLDYESSRKKFELLVRAASPPLRSDVRLEILVTDVNDNAPVLKDFQVFKAI